LRFAKQVLTIFVCQMAEAGIRIVGIDVEDVSKKWNSRRRRDKSGHVEFDASGIENESQEGRLQGRRTPGPCETQMKGKCVVRAKQVQSISRAYSSSDKSIESGAEQ